MKITCKGSNDAGGEVLRIIESLGVEITYTALDKINPMLVLVTIFIRVSFFVFFLFSSFSFNENKQLYRNSVHPMNICQLC